MKFTNFCLKIKKEFIRSVIQSPTAMELIRTEKIEYQAQLNKEHLVKVLDTCRELDTRRLIAVSVAYGKAIQNERITQALESVQHESHQGSRLADISDALVDPFEKIAPGEQANFYSLFDEQLLTEPIRINLASHGVIVAPWNLERLKVALPLYGGVKQWEQQFDHHAVIYWPIPLIIVYGGNHSFSAGVINRSGYVENHQQIRIHDISRIYDVLECNGNGLIRIADQTPVRRMTRNHMPWDLRWGILFELGRLISTREGWREEMISWSKD